MLKILIKSSMGWTEEDEDASGWYEDCETDEFKIWSSTKAAFSLSK